MNIKLGSLKFILANEHLDLVSISVAKAISSIENNDQIGVTEIDANFSDTTAFCAKYKVEMNQVANCVILEAKRADKVWFAACVIPGNTRADVNGLARRILDARKVSFAPMEKAVEESAMEYGAITPVGLPENWPILVDRAITDLEYVIIGSGIRKTKLVAPGKLFASLPNTHILDGLGRIVEKV